MASAEGGPGCGLSSPGQVSPRRPLSAPLPQGGPSTAWLRWTPRLRFGEYTEDSASVSLCLWIGCRVNRMCCPFEKSDLSSQGLSSSLSAFFSVFSEADAGNSLRFPWSRGSQNSFFFFPLEGWIPIFPCNFIGVYLVFNFMLVLGVRPSESVIHICTLDSFPV